MSGITIGIGALAATAGGICLTAGGSHLHDRLVKGTSKVGQVGQMTKEAASGDQSIRKSRGLVAPAHSSDKAGVKLDGQFQVSVNGSVMSQQHVEFGDDMLVIGEQAHLADYALGLGGMTVAVDGLTVSAECIVPPSVKVWFDKQNDASEWAGRLREAAKQPHHGQRMGALITQVHELIKHQKDLEDLLATSVKETEDLRSLELESKKSMAHSHLKVVEDHLASTKRTVCEREMELSVLEAKLEKAQLSRRTRGLGATGSGSGAGASGVGATVAGEDRHEKRTNDIEPQISTILAERDALKNEVRISDGKLKDLSKSARQQINKLQLEVSMVNAARQEAEASLAKLSRKTSGGTNDKARTRGLAPIVAPPAEAVGEVSLFFVQCGDLAKVGHASTLGLGYRCSPDMEDRRGCKHSAELYEPWGSFINASLVSEDWVHTDKGYLPTKLCGETVLRKAKESDKIGLDEADINLEVALRFAEKHQELASKVVQLEEENARWRVQCEPVPLQTSAPPSSNQYEVPAMYSAPPAVNQFEAPVVYAAPPPTNSPSTLCTACGTCGGSGQESGWFGKNSCSSCKGSGGTQRENPASFVAWTYAEPPSMVDTFDNSVQDLRGISQKHAEEASVLRMCMTEHEQAVNTLREELSVSGSAHGLSEERLSLAQAAHGLSEERLSSAEALRLQLASDLQTEAQLAADTRRLHQHAEMVISSHQEANTSADDVLSRAEALETSMNEVQQHKQELQRQLEVLQIETDSKMQCMVAEHDEVRLHCEHLRTKLEVVHVEADSRVQGVVAQHEATQQDNEELAYALAAAARQNEQLLADNAHTLLQQEHNNTRANSQALMDVLEEHRNMEQKMLGATAQVEQLQQELHQMAKSADQMYCVDKDQQEHEAIVQNLIAKHSSLEEALRIAHTNREVMRSESVNFQEELLKASEENRLAELDRAGVQDSHQRALMQLEVAYREATQRYVDAEQDAAMYSSRALSFEQSVVARHDEHQLALAQVEAACREANQRHVDVEKEAAVHASRAMRFEQCLATSDDEHQAALAHLHQACQEATRKFADAEEAAVVHASRALRLEQGLEATDGEYKQRLLDAERRLQDAHVKNELLAKEFEAEYVTVKHQAALHEQDKDSLKAQLRYLEAEVNAQTNEFKQRLADKGIDSQELENVFQERLLQSEELLRDADRKRVEVECRAAMLDKQLAIVKQTAELNKIDRESELSHEAMNENLAREAKMSSRQAQDAEDRANEMTMQMERMQQAMSQMKTALQTGQVTASPADDLNLQLQKENAELRARLSSAHDSLGSLTQKLDDERRVAEMERMALIQFGDGGQLRVPFQTTLVPMTTVGGGPTEYCLTPTASYTAPPMSSPSRVQRSVPSLSISGAMPSSPASSPVLVHTLPLPTSYIPVPSISRNRERGGNSDVIHTSYASHPNSKGHQSPASSTGIIARPGVTNYAGSGSAPIRAYPLGDPRAVPNPTYARVIATSQTGVPAMPFPKQHPPAAGPYMRPMEGDPMWNSSLGGYRR